MSAPSFCNVTRILDAKLDHDFKYYCVVISYWFQHYWKIYIQDNAPTLADRIKKSDAREIESFYKQYYEQYVLALNKGEQTNRYSYFTSCKVYLYGIV